MELINIHEAKTHLSRLVDQAHNGQPFIIAKAGKPMATVIPFEPEESKGTLWGFYEGKIDLDAWNSWSEEDQAELEKSFYEGAIFPDETIIRH